MWWTLSVIREVTTLIFSWSSLNYRVGQKVTKLLCCSSWPLVSKAMSTKRWGNLAT